MIELGTALFGGDNATSVGLENSLVGLDRDRDRLSEKGGLELIGLIRGHIVEVLHTHDALALFVLAGVTDMNQSLVRIHLFSLERGRLSVCESVVHQATHAAVVSVMLAVNELLLGKTDQLAKLNLGCSFHGTSR